MFNQLFPFSVPLIASVSIASAAGGVGGGSAGGAAGVAHGSGARGGNSFGKPAVVNNSLPALKARSPCIGAVAVIPTTGAPLPNAPPSNTNPSPTNGLAGGGTVQSNPDVPRLAPQDQGIVAEIKLANEKLGEVGNPPGRIDRQAGRPAIVTGTNDGIRRNDSIQSRDSGRSRALGPLALGDSSAVKETPDPRSIQGKPDVNRMSDESQRLAHEIIRETDKMGRSETPAVWAKLSRIYQSALPVTLVATRPVRADRRIQWALHRDKAADSRLFAERLPVSVPHNVTAWNAFGSSGWWEVAGRHSGEEGELPSRCMASSSLA
jgi:hypothetical protein